MTHLDDGCEAVLQAVNDLQKMNYIATLDFINVATKDKYAQNGELSKIVMPLIDKGYVFQNIDPTTGFPVIPNSFALRRTGEVYFNEKRKSLARDRRRWLEIIFSGIGAALITYVLTVLFS